MTEQLQLPIEIIGCPIVREIDGLAMSSRNLRLSEFERAQASFIYQNLVFARDHAGIIPVEDLKNEIIQRFQKHPAFRLEYFEIADATTLQPIKDWDEATSIRAFIAAYLGEVRLIDNMLLKTS